MGKIQPGKEPLNTILKQYRTNGEEHPIAPTRPSEPPWLMKPPKTDSALSEVISKKTSTMESMKQDALYHMKRYENSTKIFTDASKIANE